MMGHAFLPCLLWRAEGRDVVLRWLHSLGLLLSPKVHWAQPLAALPLCCGYPAMSNKAWGCGLVPVHSAPSTVTSPSQRLTLNLPLKGSMELAGLPLE